MPAVAPPGPRGIPVRGGHFPYHFLSQQARFSFAVCVLLILLMLAYWANLYENHDGR